MFTRISRLLSLGTAAVAVAGSVLVASPAVATAADECAALSTPIYRTINPRTGAQLLTRWQNEAIGSSRTYGFTEDRGVFGYASRTGADTQVMRAFNSRTGDFLWVASPSEIAAAEASGYVVQGLSFYARTTASGCTVAVHRFVKGARTRNAWAGSEQASLVAAGWTDAGASFYLNPGRTASASPSPTPTPTASTAPATPKPTPTTASAAPTTPGAPASTTPSATATPTPATPAKPDQAAASDSTFSIAVIGDTQGETNRTSDARFANRTQWLVDNRSAVGLDYVLHTGDMVNWGWLDPVQYKVATAAMGKLATAGIPYSVSIGNHDTAVVGVGGAAYAPTEACKAARGAARCKTSQLVRDTSAFNSAFPLSSIQKVGGSFESAKVDNTWTTFSAGNAKWLVLNLEFEPRAEAVAWGKQVVASHPDHNVIIQTHHYLDGNGGVSASNDGYGAKSGQYIYDEIVSKYSNVKLVFSGHTGGFTSRADTVNGNTVVSYLGNELSGTNPVRIVTINTATGKVTSTVYTNVKPGATPTTYATTSNTITIRK
jgi:hypothetical protein